jgi:hypothetical protein
MADTTRRASALLFAGLVAFVVLLGYLLAASRRPSRPRLPAWRVPVRPERPTP